MFEDFSVIQCIADKQLINYSADTMLFEHSVKINNNLVLSNIQYSRHENRECIGYI
jgi:hypothetical protein